MLFMKMQKDFKQKKILQLSPIILLLPLLLNSCTVVQNPISSLRVLNEEAKIMDIRVDDLSALMKLDREFFLYLSSDFCATCQRFTPFVENYVKNNKILVYRIKNVFTGETLKEIQEIENKDGAFPFQNVSELLPIVNAVPNFSSIKNGNRLYQLNSKNFTDESYFKASIKNYYHEGHSYLVQNFSTLLNEIETKDDFLISSYNTQTIGALDSINRQILTASNNSKKPAYLLDLPLVGNPTYQINQGILSGMSFGENQIIYKIKGETKTRMITYNDPGVSSLITSYFK